MICNLRLQSIAMNRIALLFTLLLLTLNCLAQADPEIDSLKSVITSQKDDSTKVKTLIDLGMLYMSTDIEEALKYGNQARELAEKKGYTKQLGFALKLLGIASATKADYVNADVYFKASLKAYEAVKFKDGIASILNNLGSLNFTIGEDTKAIEYHLKSLKIAEEIGNKLRMGTNLNNIGTVYSKKPATVDKALDYFLKALPLFEEIEYTDGIGTATVNIGEIYFKKQKYDSALPFFKRSIQMYEGTADAAYALSYVGEIYSAQRDFETAFTYHNQAIALTEKVGAQLYLAQSLLSLARTQRAKGDIVKSIQTYKRAEQISLGIKAREEIKISYEELSKNYAEVGDFKNAYEYGTLLTSLKDTLYNSDEDKKVQQLQFNFDLDKKEAEIQLQDATIQQQKIINYAAAFSGFLLLIVAIISYNRYKFVRKTNQIIKSERDRSKQLLLNILPEETARELETDGSAKTRYYENVTVLFTDFKGFSTIAGKMAPQELVSELNDYFGTFDEIVGQYGLEKIKTIGDAYMCAGGIPVVNDTHALNAVKAAEAMQAYMQKKSKERMERGEVGWELRVGIHTGPVVAGVVGKKKYAYDIWGDTVNIASRMESNGEPGKINISSSTYSFVKNSYECIHRGKISAKNIGEVDMYFVQAEIPAPA